MNAGHQARRDLLLAMAGVALVPVASAKPSDACFSDAERRAIALIDRWAAALLARDAELAVSLFDQQCQYRDDPFQTSLKQGSALLLEDLTKLLRGLKSMTIESAYAVGSDKDVLVLVRRVDAFVLGNKTVQMPMAGYFRVRGGKILEWLDTPLAEMPPPPAGMPPPK